MKQQKLDDFAVLAAIYDRKATKWRVMNALLSEELTVQEMSRALNIEQSNLSHQLTALKQSGLVDVHREGKYRRFQLSDAITFVRLKEVLMEMAKGRNRLIIQEQNGATTVGRLCFGKDNTGTLRD